MNNEHEKQKFAGVIANFAKNTAGFGKKVAIDTKANIAALVEKTKKGGYARKLKKYNPVFPEQFKSDQFKLPNMIMIVDDAVRRGIDVCEGAIGWLDDTSGIEVLRLYDEAVQFSGITFIPSATCDAFYYVDSFDRTKFIRTDCIFSKAHEERMAELENVAYCIGAKKCSVKIREQIIETQQVNKHISANEAIEKNEATVEISENADQSVAKDNKIERIGLNEVVFEGSSAPTRPNLKWFAYDDNILGLVEMCCNNYRTVKSKRLNLSGSSSATMSQKTAYSIDTAIEKLGGIKGGVSLNSQAKKECQSELIFQLEF